MSQVQVKNTVCTVPDWKIIESGGGGFEWRLVGGTPGKLLVSTDLVTFPRMHGY